MSALGATEPDQLKGSSAYESNQEVSQSYHFEWTIQSFNHLMNVAVQTIEKPFFPPESDSKPDWVFKVDKDTHGYFFFTLYASDSIGKYVVVNRSLRLKSLDHVYELPAEKNVVDSSANLFSFSLKGSELEEHMKWNVDGKLRDLTIICEVSIADSSKRLRNKRKLKCIYDEDISDQRNYVVNEDSFKDFSFVVQDQTIHVSKVILALESPVFAAMFKSKMSEGLNSEEIKDIEPVIFLKMIQFIYDQKVDQADLEKSALQLFKVALKYDVMKLKQICATFLYNNFCVDNAVEILILADLYSIYGLKEKALRMIKLNLNILKESEDLKNCIRENPHLAVDLVLIKVESADYLCHSLGKTKYIKRH